MLYSKNGSIPKPETDGTEGWVQVPDAPDCPEGMEVIWWLVGTIQRLIYLMGT